MKLDSEEFLRHCADTYYRGEGYVPVGVPVLDTRAFYDVLRSGGWAPQWSRVYSGLWVPAWMQPLLRVAADGAEAPDPSRVELLVREVARALWRPASDATIQAVLAAVGWPPAWRVRHPLELDILTTLDGPAAIRACLESRGVRVVVPPPSPPRCCPCATTETAVLCERAGCGRTVPARPTRRAAFAGLCKHCRHNVYVRVRNGLSADLDTARAWLRANAALPTIRPWPPGWIACRRSGCPSGTAPPREAGYPPKPELVGFCAPCRTHAWQRVQSGRSASTRDAAQWLDTHPKRPQRHARAPQTTPASASETHPPPEAP